MIEQATPQRTQADLYLILSYVRVLLYLSNRDLTLTAEHTIIYSDIFIQVILPSPTDNDLLLLTMFSLSSAGVINGMLTEV